MLTEKKWPQKCELKFVFFFLMCVCVTTHLREDNRMTRKENRHSTVKENVAPWRAAKLEKEKERKKKDAETMWHSRASQVLVLLL